MSILKPCPFCGEKEDIHTAWYNFSDTGSKADVECANCFCGTDFFDDIDDAINAWNKRSKAPEIKNCPFCGGSASIVHEKHYGNVVSYIRCSKCHATSISSISVEYIINVWNNRSDI